MVHLTALIDTHVLIWSMQESGKISAAARDVLEDPENSLLLSAASLWELSIKTSLGRLDLRENTEDIIRRNLLRLRIKILPVGADHALGVMRLPFHHRDPFDRLLVSQCTIEKIPLISMDVMMKKYGIEVIW